jgi:hypothetical protein
MKKLVTILATAALLSCSGNYPTRSPEDFNSAIANYIKYSPSLSNSNYSIQSRLKDPTRGVMIYGIKTWEGEDSTKFHHITLNVPYSKDKPPYEPTL